MSETSPTPDSAATQELTRAIREEMLPLADLLEETFTRTARHIEEELATAAKNGSLSFRSMTEEILNDLARLAAEELVREPIENAILRVLGQGGINPGGSTGNSPGPQSGQRSGTQAAEALAKALSKAGRNA
ncbi:phage tail tape measure C-terminal domain-containing protein [Parvularcula sp. IMCC14364]|uniref:phage tail tape measure C-terminal domain-containing protein n=1 Tax=Parvularcula sp. IMCC14364 TaxID=3067902 RepID=UPI0027404426|nr:phage tail tape measure C-terminal domain-containing protein [Parvularcula sp. IMCC14364]